MIIALGFALAMAALAMIDCMFLRKDVEELSIRVKALEVQHGKHD